LKSLSLHSISYGLWALANLIISGSYSLSDSELIRETGIVLASSSFLVLAPFGIRFSKIQILAVLSAFTLLLCSAASGDLISIAGGLLFLHLIISISIGTSNIPHGRVLKYLLFGALGSIIGFIPVIYTALSNILNSESRGNTLAHPNLIGNYGLLFVSYAVIVYPLVSTRIHRTLALSLLLLGLCLSFSVASRGGLFASLIVVFIVISGSLFAYSKSRKASALLLVIVIPCLLLAPAGVIPAEFLTEKLELNSNYRGLDSKLTGRVYVWYDILDIVSNPVTLLTGNGFRLGSNSVSGKAIDNMYLQLLLEGGLFCLILYLTAVGAICYQRFIAALGKHNTSYHIAVLAVIIGSLAVGVVNRQSFAMGNSYSLLILFIILLPVHLINWRNDAS
jgi:hypothetical protein